MDTIDRIQASQIDGQTSSNSFSLSDLSQGSTLTMNVQQDCIVTTYDKTELVLMKYEKAKQLSNWWTYLTMFVTFLVPSLTADFHDFMGIQGDFLSATFWILSVAFLIITIISFAKWRKNKNKITIKYCVDSIKNGSFSE